MTVTLDRHLGQPCEAMTWASGLNERCKRQSRHWTPPLANGERHVLCLQHFRVMQHWERRGRVRILTETAWCWK